MLATCGPQAGWRHKSILDLGARKRFLGGVSKFDRRAQLITYPDSLGGSLRSLRELLLTEMSGLFGGGVHLLPPFPSTADRGFAPTRYDEIDPAFGTWGDLATLARSVPTTLDVMVNHMSAQSKEFRDFALRGRASKYADMFMRPDKVWPGGVVPQEDLDAIFLRKPKNPFLNVRIGETGVTEVVWATFGKSEHESDQIDLDWQSPLTLDKYDAWFSSLASVGATEVRLDAAGYLSKRAGTSSFMVEPDIWEALDTITAIAARHGLSVLPEIHAQPDKIAALDGHGHPRYDFVLPGLLLDAFRTCQTHRLVAHLSTLPTTVVTTLATHDGIPIQPDLVGIVDRDDLVALSDLLVQRGANLNRILGATDRGIDFDVHQVNISYLDAAGSEDALVLARAVQLFSPGRPQIYYQSLLGGPNDDAAVTRTGEGRTINRTNYSVDQAREALQSSASRRQQRLLELRSKHQAFAAERPIVDAPRAGRLRMRWETEQAWCELLADLGSSQGEISMSPHPGLDGGFV